MNVKFDRLNDVTANITVTLEEKDYAEKVKKNLKDISKNHAEPGFRPGHVPAGLIQKKYGTAVKYDVINKEVSDALYNYINDNKLMVLGNPIPEKNEKFDIEDTDFTFTFRVGLAPEIKNVVDKNLTIPYYTIEVSDEMIDRQNDALRRRFGQQVPGDKVEPDALVKGVICELDENGNPKEGGVVVENGIVAPKYFKSEKQRKLFEDKKVGDIVVFNPWETCDGNATELASMLNVDKKDAPSYKGDFSMEIKEIIVLRLAELNQEYYDQVFGKDNVKDEEQYRDQLKKMIAGQLVADSNFRFTIDAKDAIVKAVGDVDLPEDIMKDFLKSQNEGLNDENIDSEFEKIRPELVWQLLRDDILRKSDIKVEEADIMNVARMMAQNQFSQYGMTNLPDDVLDKYAKDILKDKRAHEQVVNQAIDMKFYSYIRDNVNIDNKNVTVEEFNALFAPVEDKK